MCHADDSTVEPVPESVPEPVPEPVLMPVPATTTWVYTPSGCHRKAVNYNRGPALSPATAAAPGMGLVTPSAVAEVQALQAAGATNQPLELFSCGFSDSLSLIL